MLQSDLPTSDNIKDSDMKQVPFDTLAYAKKLKGAGLSDQQAEIHAEALLSVVGNHLATKADIKKLDHHIQTEVTRLVDDMLILEERLTHKLTIRLGSLMLVGVSVLATLMKLI